MKKTNKLVFKKAIILELNTLKKIKGGLNDTGGLHTDPTDPEPEVKS